MKKNVVSVRRRKVHNRVTSDDCGALQKQPKATTSVVYSSVIANVLTLMLHHCVCYKRAKNSM